MTGALRPSKVGPLALLALMLVSALVFLYVKTSAHDSSGYFENVALLRQIKHLDAQWEVDVLRARLGTTRDYDALGDPLAALNGLRISMQGMLAREGHAAPAALAAGADAFAVALREKTRLIEHFKSHNAVLRNSLAFLPTAAGDVRALPEVVDAGDQAKPNLVLAQINDVLLDSLVFSLTPTEDSAAEIESSLRQLFARNLARPAVDGDALVIFAAHVRAVLREQPLVDALLRDIASAPAAERIDHLDNLLSMEAKENARQESLYRLCLLGFATALACLLLYLALHLIRSHAVIRRVNKALVEANAALEHRVEERTRELRVAQADLIASARQAGMAEIATNVLHNVGNVLNSVNISAGLVGARLHASKAKGLARAVDMMDAHIHHLGEFLTGDAKGRLLPGYLRGVSRSIETEQRGMLDELAALSRNIDHIKEIVATQQSYAGGSSLVEEARVEDLVDDALRISASSSSRLEVEVVKQIADLPSVQLDRHRLMQILVNLLSNARHAFDTVSDGHRRITICAESPCEGTLRICVTDNGAGIAAGHLDRVFSHGFTTRKDGHGFGLHSCVIAAQEMGGTLGAHSDGPGRGAAFTLMLPIQPAGASR